MAKLFYIQASPRGERSKSIQVADAFIKAYRQSHPSDTVETLNVFEADLPVFDGAAAAAKFKIPHNEPTTPQERQVWSQVEAVIARFKAADKYVLAVPMWNFGIPYRLKQYIDIIVQPGYTFTVGEKGYEGLVTGKPLMGVYARGGTYAKGTPSEGYDLQSRYIEQIFGFMGFTSIGSIEVEPMLAQGDQAAQKAIADAIAKTQTLAKTF